MVQQGTEGLFVAIIVLFSLCITLILFFTIFQKKKNVLLLKQAEDKKQFEKEINESQVEIREQILRNISWELHDNIGQLLTLAKIQLQGVAENPENIKEVNDNLTNILSEVRSLSKVINPDFITNINLGDAIQLEIDRFNRLNYIKSTLDIEGEHFDIDPKSEIVIFRILQEFFSNTVKHSRATELNVHLNYADNTISILAEDNGKGFDMTKIHQNGIGLNNMRKRGVLINADISIESKVNEGTKLKIIYNQVQS
ncbi:MAG: histidine kinase [Flavobacteriales bacterium]|nr:histidine kinase [Flavobacteriales bacterium]